MLKKRSFIFTILQQSSWYYLCSALNNGLAILLLPFLSHQLSTEEYGIIQLSTGIGLFLPMFFSCGVDKSIYRYYNEYKFLPEKRNLISTVYWFAVFSGLSILSLFVLSSYFWFEPVVHTSPFPYIWLFAYPYLFAQISTIGQSYFQQIFDLKRMTIIEVLGTGINLSLSIYFVMKWQDGALARLSAIAFAFLFKASVYTYFLIKRDLLNFHIDFNKLKEYLLFSLPLLPNSVTLWIGRTFDRVLVSFFCGTSIAGIYSTGVQVSFVLYFIQDAITQAFGPMQIRLFINDKIKALERLELLSKIMFLLMTLITLWYCSFCQTLMNLILDERFIPPVILIFLLTFVYVLQSQYRLFSDVIIYYKKNKYFMYAGLVQALISLILNIIFIPIFGYVMAAFSSVFSVFIYTIIVIFFAMKISNLTIDCYFYFKYTVFFFLISFFNLYIVGYMGNNATLIKMFVLLLYSIYIIKRLFLYAKVLK